MWRDKLENRAVRVVVTAGALVLAAGGGWMLRGEGAGGAGRNVPADPGVSVGADGGVVVQTGQGSGLGAGIEVFVPATTCAGAISRMEETILRRLGESNTPLVELERFDQDLSAARDLCSYNTYREFAVTYLSSYLDLRGWTVPPDPIPNFERLDIALGGRTVPGVPNIAVPAPSTTTTSVPAAETGEK